MGLSLCLMNKTIDWYCYECAEKRDILACSMVLTCHQCKRLQDVYFLSQKGAQAFCDECVFECPDCNNIFTCVEGEMFDGILYCIDCWSPRYEERFYTKCFDCGSTILHCDSCPLDGLILCRTHYYFRLIKSIDTVDLTE